MRNAYEDPQAYHAEDYGEYKEEPEMEFRDQEEQQAYRDAELKANEAFALEAQARRAHAAARAIMADIKNTR
eukprot:11490309-Alexandrium_andersonii.AAC.1